MLLETLGAYIARTAAGIPVMREASRTAPAPDSSALASEALGDAAVRRMEKTASSSPERQKAVILDNNVPADLQAYARNPNAYASYSRMYAPMADGKTPDLSRPIASRIQINPNASRDVFAHELGHHISDQTKIGNMIANLRHNPKMAKALAGAAMGIPFVQSALQEGDDDLASGIAISALLSSPTLIDEALATKNGLAIMKDAGMPATAGQRGRLAGAYLTYAAAPILAGMGGNLLGNIADDYTAVYDL